MLEGNTDRLASFYAFAERMSGDVSRCADFWNQAPGGRTINKLPALLERDSHAGRAGEEARSFCQQLHGSMKFQRRRLP